MRMLDAMRRFWAHRCWADDRVFAALEVAGQPDGATAEYAHILGAEETWLSRLESRAVKTAVWPQMRGADLAALRADVASEYDRYLAKLDEAELGRAVAYTNSAGQSFANSAADILLQVFLHGQYHRGKVNLLLRQAGAEPAPADFIAFVRGVDAATRRG